MIGMGMNCQALIGQRWLLLVLAGSIKSDRGSTRTRVKYARTFAAFWPQKMYIQTAANIVALLLLSRVSNALDIPHQQPRIVLGLHKASPGTIVQLPPRLPPRSRPQPAARPPAPPHHYPAKPARAKPAAVVDDAGLDSLDALLGELGSQLREDAARDTRSDGPAEYVEHLLATELNQAGRLNAAEQVHALEPPPPRRMDSAESRRRFHEARNRDQVFEAIRRKQQAVQGARRGAEPAGKTEERQRRRRDVFFDQIRRAW